MSYPYQYPTDRDWQRNDASTSAPMMRDWASKQYLRRPRNHNLLALVFWVCVISFVAGYFGL